jgi:hypothetical protein
VAQPASFPDPIHVPAGAWGRSRRLFAGLAAAGLALGAVAFAVDRPQFYHSWLTALVFGLTVALGSLFFVMLQHVTRAGWSVAVRRLAEISAWTIPFFAVLFLPLVAGMKDLFPWTGAEAAHDPLIRHKSAYLNPTFFFVRAALYFAVWTFLARYFLRRSLAQDESKDFRITIELQRRSAPGIILYGFALTFMAFDWLMSADPHWYSTIFGVYIFSGSTLSSFAFLTLVAMALRRGGYLAHTVRTDHYHDLGRLMFAFSVFWTYIAFCQFFLIWYGNIPEETVFYAHRLQGSWKAVSLFLAFGHFVVPFVLLMPRFTKRRPKFVAGMAVWILFIHYLDLHWIVMPNHHREGFAPCWVDLAALAAVLGVFLTLFTRKLAGHALVPAGDPRLPESLALEHLY